MPRLVLIFLHSASADGSNVQHLFLWWDACTPPRPSTGALGAAEEVMWEGMMPTRSVETENYYCSVVKRTVTVMVLRVTQPGTGTRASK
jgi:hypothetical protein